MKPPILKVQSMDERRAFLERLYDAKYRLGNRLSRGEGWDYFIEAVGSNDTHYIYWSVEPGKAIGVYRHIPMNRLMVNSPAQFFAYLKHCDKTPLPIP